MMTLNPACPDMEALNMKLRIHMDSLPKCHLTLRGLKPLPAAYPQALDTLHLLVVLDHPIHLHRGAKDIKLPHTVYH